MAVNCMWLLVAAFALVGADDAEWKEEDFVLVLEEKTFDDALTAFPDILVEFYAPWCGHCKALAPEYAAAAKLLREAGSPLRLAKVDATVESRLAEKFEVRGYPTLKFFSNGKPQEYKGGRKADEIISWLKKKTGPPAQSLGSVDELTALTEANDVVIVGHFAAADSDNAKAFEQVARELDLPFALATDSAIFTHLKVATDGDQVVILKKFDEGQVTYSGDWTAEDLSRFVTRNQLPSVVEFSPETAPKIFGGELKLHTLLFTSKKHGEFDSIMDAFRSVSKELKDSMLFVLIDTDTEDNSRVMDFFGVKSADLPEIRAVSLGNEMLKFRMPKETFDVATIKQFCEDVVNKRIKPHLLSEELPSDWDAKPVKVLVSGNYDAITQDANKQVFVELYAPWCGHCKQLAPIWDQLAELYKDRDDLVIAKMDSTANEVEGVKVSGFPTLKWYGRGENKTPVDYQGERTLEALKKFIDSDGKVEAKTPASHEEEEEEEEEDEHKDHGHDHVEL